MNKEIELEVICKCINKGMGVNGEYDIETYMYCPQCGEISGDYEDDELWYNYCPNCGQKLKYTEKE